MSEVARIAAERLSKANDKIKENIYKRIRQKKQAGVLEPQATA